MLFRSPEPSVFVRYEDYCSSKDPIPREISSLLGIQLRRPAEGAPGAQKQEHLIAGNVIRLRPVRTIAVDETWRTRLSSTLQKGLYLLVLPWMRRYGYHL